MRDRSAQKGIYQAHSMFQRLQPPVVELAVLSKKDLKIGVAPFLPYVSEGKQQQQKRMLLYNVDTRMRDQNTKLTD